MKAFLLAAGLGTRLRPLTDRVPKCMISIDGRPLLDIWLDSLADAGVDEVLVNLHHLPEVVRGHLQARRGGPLTYPVFERELLGSAGTLAANRTWAEGEDVVLVCNADNLTDFDVGSLVEFHRQHEAIATLTLFEAEHPSACGVVEVDDEWGIVNYVEKPDLPRSNLANAGIYAFNPRLFQEIEGPAPKDIGYDLLPRLVGRARAMLLTGYFRDIGTPDAYERAQHEWPTRSQR